MGIKDNLKNISYVYIIIPLVLSIIGIIFIYSSGIIPEGGNTGQYIRQLIWVVIGISLGIVVLSVDYYQLVETSEYYYIAGILMLIVVLIFGTTVRGAKSWLGIGSLGIQPSEIMKIFYIILYAKFLGNASEKEKKNRNFLISLGLVAIPLALVMAQPDLGTAIVYIFIFIFMSIVGMKDIKNIINILLIGLVTVVIVLGSAYYKFYYLEQGGHPLEMFEILFNMKTLLVIAITMFIISAIAFVIRLFRPIDVIEKVLPVTLVTAISFIFSAVSMKVLKPYQWKRLLVFLNPEFDKWGAGYNIIQSKIAVGSGGFFGKGLFRGTQNTLGFLPEKSTDFIFSIICEELGFFGGSLIVIAFGVYFYFIIRVIHNAKDKEGMLIATGILAMFFTHFIINIGMTLGIAPATGLPLPFISYGGSSYLTFIISAAMLSNIYSHRFLH